MERKPKLVLNNSEDIGFATDCLLMGLISLNEFKEWVCKIINKYNIEDVPEYLYDLADYNEDVVGVYNIIGFSPNSNLKEEDEHALYGIAVKRFGVVFDMPISSKKALVALKKNPQVLVRFKREFSFINLDF
ncbi:hypothetical protein A4G19_09095 [Pasteurellaceae bacterium Macca]|nr:hypothetical protein [Pasteurellaceae bacterium Macca]